MDPSGPGQRITRDDVLEFLRRQSSLVTTEEICASFECQDRTVRRHLDALAERERIRREEVSESSAGTRTTSTRTGWGTSISRSTAPSE